MNKQNNNKSSHKKHYRRYAREWAMQFLFQCDLSEIEEIEENLSIFIEQTDDNELLSSPIPSESTYKKAKRSAERIIRGVKTNIKKIDQEISYFSPNWNIQRMDAVDRNIMRIAVFEMFFCNNVPPVVSINEAVELGKSFGSQNSASFINGILNSIKDALNRPAREK